MSRRAGSVLALSGVLLLAAAAPASAEAKGRIIGIESRPGSLQVVFTVAGLAAGERIDPATAQVSLAGQAVEAEVRTASAAAGTQVARQVMLTVDTSGSMAGPGIIGARRAASTFLDEVPADVQVGLVTFADTAQLRVPLTTDRARVRRVVTTLQARGDTALYDAVVLASRSLPDKGDRQILLLSDGADDGSKTTLPQVKSLLDKGDVALNAVAFQNTEVQSTLGELTRAAGGRVVSTTQTAQLTAAFKAAANALGNQIVLTVPVPAELEGQEATVTVDAVAEGQPVSDSALVASLQAKAEPLPQQDYGPRPVQVASGPLHSIMALYGALAAMFLGLLFLLGTALAGVGGRRNDTVQDRLSVYTLSGGAAAAMAPAAGDSRSQVSRSAVGLAERVVQSGGLEARLATRLEAGGIPLKPAEWLIVHVGTVLCLPLFVLLITNANLVLVLASLVLAVLGPLGYLSLKQSLRTRAFLAQLPDVLQLLSGSLSAGYSLPQAVDAVVRQGNEPVAAEFNKALVEARLGAPIEDSLDDVATRMQSVDFHWVVMAIRIQRDVGGNLSEILATVASTLRERERLRRQVKVLSAEGRLSAWILGGLPPAFALYLLAAQPSYIKPLFTEALGLLMLAVMGVLMAVGTVWLRKVVKVEV